MVINKDSEGIYKLWKLAQELSCDEFHKLILSSNLNLIENLNISKLEKELGLDKSDLAEFFNMTYGAFANSSAKQRYENALCRFYECVLLGGKKEN
ncbi:MAG: hypothetical protein GY749_30930 [Desulfobacteraceae bacterium]|nr:hypothetical protein [Desulfobacteraceae bacterium]